TFGIPELMSGFTFTPMLIGVLVMPEVIMAIRQRHNSLESMKLVISPNPADNRISWKEYKSVLGTIVKSAGIGTFMGSLPGLGSTPAAFMAYGEAKRTSKNPEQFGKGSIRGIAAAESANNAVCAAAMIPMLTLSIPGDDVTALLFGAFLIQGITPGPTIFFEHTQVIYGIFAGFLLTDFFLLFLARIGFKFWTKVASVPRYFIFPCVTVFAFAGAYTTNQNINDVLILIVFTMLGFSMRLIGLNPAAFLIGFILTPMLEQNLDQAVAIVGDDYAQYFTTPFAWVFTALAAISVYSTWRQKKKAALKAELATPASGNAETAG
ncbi:MAG: tripartite tricarboxylate transporter permease, partial [Desulfobacterales bacterium]|nr:tripartite tricarboxylate transporter permease [Desulfobacterales bacterium]